MSSSDLIWSSAIAVLLSCLVVCIEIPAKSKTQFRACFNVQSLLYWLVLSFGNVITTLLVSLAVAKISANLAPYYFLFCPFFGVFGFETVLKNTNVTMFDRGVLTIQNWIQKALDSAAGAAIDQQENMKQEQESKLVKKLMVLSEEDINTRILHKMGPNAVGRLESAARASSANIKQYKIFQLIATLSRSESNALLRSR